MNLISKTKVPHTGPIDSPIFILGEAPGSDDDYYKQPFMGKSGELLTFLLSSAGIDREECRLGNTVNYQPVGNKFELLRGTRQLDESHHELNLYLYQQKPKIIIALGNEALRFLKGHGDITNWRGSVLPYDASTWIVPTYHPASVFRNGKYAPQISNDLLKAKKVSELGYTYPLHNFHLNPDTYTFELSLAKVRSVPFTAADIETHPDSNTVLCFGYAVSSTEAYVIKNHRGIGQGYDEQFILDIKAVVENSRSLTFHNGSYDTTWLRFCNIYDIRFDKFSYDTQIAQRVIQPELPTSLAFCASIYTDEAYYKDDGKSIGKKIPLTLLPYCATDCIVTYQTREKQEEIFSKDQTLANDAYQFMFKRIPLMQELQDNGMLVDRERRTLLRDSAMKKLDDTNTLAQFATGWKLNFRSSAQVMELLYDKLELPVQRNPKTKERTANEDAIVYLIQYVSAQKESVKKEITKAKYQLILHLLGFILKIREYEKLVSSYLGGKDTKTHDIDQDISDDGRLHSSYKPAATDTGRWACGKFHVGGKGLNAQTFPRGSIAAFSHIEEEDDEADIMAD